MLLNADLTAEIEVKSLRVILSSGESHRQERVH